MNAFRQFKWTRKACYMGYITQAIANNFMPLLFLTFEKSFGISLSQISVLIVVNFTTQLTTDLIAARIVDRLNLRAVAVSAQMLAAAGLLAMGLLPNLLPSPFLGLLIATLLCAVGGGMDEVIVSPLMEACPGDGKEASMSLLHSFYCWGQAGVILLSVGFFTLFGIENWAILATVMALFPFCGGLLFAVVPILRLQGEEGGTTIRHLFSYKVFFWLLLMIFAGGAAEMVMSQWASSFAEAGLGVNKALGDLMGPCLFAVLMGLSRIIYARIADKVDLLPVIAVSALLCAASYLLTALSPIPILSLLGCALCGFSVGIFWPGVYSLSAKQLPDGGVPMFAILAIAGDLGCLTAPAAAGWITDLRGGDMRLSFLLSVSIPVLILIGAGVLRHYVKRSKKSNT
ncbi:MAG: MFS transporter [Ruminococcaceae bacterium]|nr:MFS transporter [Oscillospiraceae bacterium]